MHVWDKILKKDRRSVPHADWMRGLKRLNYGSFIGYGNYKNFVRYFQFFLYKQCETAMVNFDKKEL